MAPAPGTKNTPLFGDSLQLFNFGFELKYFPLEDIGLFTRNGMGWNHLKTKGTLPKSNGWSLYAGVGWEFLWGKVGIVPEIAIRQSYLQNNLEITTFTPSLAIHFYNYNPLKHLTIL